MLLLFNQISAVGVKLALRHSHARDRQGRQCTQDRVQQLSRFQGSCPCPITASAHA